MICIRCGVNSSSKKDDMNAQWKTFENLSSGARGGWGGVKTSLVWFI